MEDLFGVGIEGGGGIGLFALGRSLGPGRAGGGIVAFGGLFT